jgi:ribosomal protein S6--L-glutamate ligase
VFVVGGRPVAAMKRTGRNDWRTNVARGAAAEAVELSPADADLAIRAAAAVGAEIAGVDLLPVGSRRYVLEVNAVPGWQALARATGRDIAADVLRYAAGP